MRIVLFLAILALAQSYKILVYETRFSQSIANYLGNIADTLVDAGHDVTALINIVDVNHRESSEKSKKIYIQPTAELKAFTDFIPVGDDDFFHYDDFNVVYTAPMLYVLMHMVNTQCKGVLDEPGLIDKLREEHFDVMIVESFEMCGVALSYLIKPRSLITTAGSIPMGRQVSDFGLEPTLSYNPSPLTSFLDPKSFWSRLKNFYAHFVFRAIWFASEVTIDNLFYNRYGNDFPGTYELCSRAAYTFINSEPLIDFATPTLNRIIHIGGIGAKEAKPLNEEFDNLLSLRNRTVMVSFGSVVGAHTMPIGVKENIVKVVSRFDDVTFIWKYEKVEDAFAKKALKSTPNLHLSKWLPQNDLLADRRLIAFITHGGMASTQETAFRGAPGLFVPFLGDQPRNAGMMEKSGVGKVFNKLDLSDETKFYDAVKDLLENQSYHENARRLSAMIERKPFSAKELVVKTVEFAAEFGPSSALRPQSYDMSWIEYHNVDIIVFCALLIAVILFAAFKIACAIIGRAARKLKSE